MSANPALVQTFTGGAGVHAGAWAAWIQMMLLHAAHSDALCLRLNAGELAPAPFAHEVFVLKRPKVGFELDGVQTANGR